MLWKNTWAPVIEVIAAVDDPSYVLEFIWFMDILLGSSPARDLRGIGDLNVNR